MTEPANPEDRTTESAPSVTNVSGGVNVTADQVSVSGDLVAGSKIIGYTADQVSALLTQITATFQAKPFDGRCPYIGLDAFDEDRADLFFGRERLIAELIDRVKASRAIFITGPSGGGKSSLVRAGLIHALKRGAVQGSDHWLYASLKPGRDPIEQLASAMARMAKSPAAGDYLRGHASEIGALHKCAESLLSDRRDQQAVILVDQFEEIFTQVAKESERATFFDLLTHAATVDNGRVIVLYAMRSDFVSNCAAYPQLNALLNQQFLQVGAMQPDELVSAIAQPALRVGLKIDPDLIAQIINDMEGEPGVLPLMQFALKDLFDAQQARGGAIALTLADYLARGGIHKSLERHADAEFAKLNHREQKIAQDVFTGLIQIGPGQDTRRTVAFDELVPADGNRVDVESVVNKLADARLITTDEQAGKDVITISHEKLIDAWPWLRKLVNENRDVIVLQNQIAEDANAWEKNQRDSSYLYVGARLADVQERLATKKIMLSGLAQAFVDTGVDAEETERQREEARRQKELDDARRMAEMAEARARAERKVAARTRLLALVAIVIAALLAIQPITRTVLRQQAMIPMVELQASEVYLGIDSAGQPSVDYLARRLYQVAAFAIEPYEVTNRRYQLCVQAGGCSLPIAPSATYSSTDQADMPVVNITALQAAQFCDWLQRRLPDEREWERTARGTDERPWPWSAKDRLPTSPDLANFIYGGVQPPLVAVGQAHAGATPEGVFDLAGNAWEWTSSSYNPKGKDWTDIHADPPGMLAVRGGGFDITPDALGNIAYRLPSSPFQPSPDTGFRCAVSR